jgi:hypothetical protein
MSNILVFIDLENHSTKKAILYHFSSSSSSHMSGYNDLDQVNDACSNEHSNLVDVLQGLPLLVQFADHKHFQHGVKAAVASGQPVPAQSHLQWVANTLWKAGQKFCHKIGMLELKETDQCNAQLREVQNQLKDVEKKLEASQQNTQNMLVGAAAMYVVTSAYTCYYTYRSIDVSLGQLKEDEKEIAQVEQCLEDYHTNITSWFSDFLTSLNSEEGFNLYKTLYELECIKNVVQEQETRLTKIIAAVEKRIAKIKARASAHKGKAFYGVLLLSGFGYSIWSGASTTLLSGAAAGVALATALNIYCWALADDHVKMLEEQRNELKQLHSRIEEVLTQIGTLKDGVKKVKN